MTGILLLLALPAYVVGLACGIVRYGFMRGVRDMHNYLEEEDKPK